MRHNSSPTRRADKKLTLEMCRPSFSESSPHNEHIVPSIDLCDLASDFMSKAMFRSLRFPWVFIGFFHPRPESSPQAVNVITGMGNPVCVGFHGAEHIPHQKPHGVVMDTTGVRDTIFGLARPSLEDELLTITRQRVQERHRRLTERNVTS